MVSLTGVIFLQTTHTIEWKHARFQNKIVSIFHLFDLKMLPIRILLKHTGLSAVLNLRIHMMNRTKVTNRGHVVYMVLFSLVL